MKPAFLLALSGFAACIGCAADSIPGTDETTSFDVVDVAAPDATGDMIDVAAPDVISDIPDALPDLPDETDATECDEFCLGACASERFDAPPGECTGYLCSIDPGITGRPHAIPGGGWLLESSPALCVTDTEAWRLSRLKSDGTFEVLQKLEINLMGGDQTLPSLASAQADRYFLIQDGCPYAECRADLADKYASLGAWSYDNKTPLWKIGGPELQYGNLASVVAVNADRIWVLSTAWQEGNLGHSHLIAIKFDGTVASTFEIPGQGWLKSSLAGPDRFLLIFRSVAFVEQDETHAIYAFSVDTQGVLTGPIDIDTIVLSESEWLLTRFKALRTGILAHLKVDGSDVQPPPRKTRMVNLDGSVRWTHEGAWDDANPDLFGTMFELDDGQIVLVPQNENVLQMIAADGQSITKGVAIPAPTDEFDWGIASVHFRDDAVLVSGTIDRAMYEYTLFVALYSNDLSTLLWSRTYGDGNSPGGLLPDGDGWMVWYDRCKPWMVSDGGDEFSCGERCAGTYLHFDSVCGE